MDWDLKVPPWNFAELERADNCSFDLKLGGLGYIKPSDYSKNKSSLPMMSSSSSKRPRAQSNGCHVASCSADGCLSDLSKCREYHKRHRVCEVHSKTAVVMVGGREQRFCQQCSRFHLLPEFDEVKRSCRKRLDGHNRRRRKPQPDPQASGSFPNQQAGNRTTCYNQLSKWPMLIKTEEEPLLQHFPLSSCGSYEEAKQFPFSQENNKISSSLSSSKLFDSDCALSLLSSSASIISSGNLSLAPGISIPIGQPPVPITHFVCPSRYDSRASDNIFPHMFSCSVEEERDFGSHGLFGDRLEGSSDGNSQTLPFAWQ